MLQGSNGNDTLVGGADQDSFVFYTWENQGHDTIKDFDPDVDVIILNNASGFSVEKASGGAVFDFYDEYGNQVGDVYLPGVSASEVAASVVMNDWDLKG